jgi:hypothetical protein
MSTAKSKFVEIDREVWKFRQRCIDSLPDYAFDSEDGSVYVRQEYMVNIEKKMADKRIQLLEEYVKGH